MGFFNFGNMLQICRKLYMPLTTIVAAIVYIMFFRSAPVPEVAKESAVSSSVKTSKTVTKTLRTIQPDGTIQETVIKERESVKVKEKTTEKVVVPVSKSDYRLGLDYVPSFDRSPQKTDVRAKGGARLGKSDFWLEGSYDFKNSEIALGFSYEW